MKQERRILNKFFCDGTHVIEKVIPSVKNKPRDEKLEAWANYVRDGNDWKKIHTRFINAQFEKSEEFLKRLSKQKGGREKIIELYGIKNIKGYEKLLGN